MTPRIPNVKKGLRAARFPGMDRGGGGGMKRLAISVIMGGLVASTVAVPGAARSTPEMRAMPPQGRWSDVPTLALHAPPPATSDGRGWGARRWAGRSAHSPGEFGGPWGGTRHRFRQGFFLPSFWVSPRFVVGNWQGYGLGAPGYGQNWIRYYDDAYLIDRSGRIYDSVYDLDWDRYDHGPVPEYVGPGPDEEEWGAPTCCVANGAQVYSFAPGTTTVIIQSVPVVTTTTTVTEEVVYRQARSKGWKLRRTK